MLDKLISLHKYWIHSNICYEGFKGYHSTNVDKILECTEELNSLKFHLLNLDHYGFYRSYWYSSLYVVIEGYLELKINNGKIDNLIAQTLFVDKLRLFRNSIFHFQKEIYNHKFLGVDDSDEFVEWIYKLHKTFGEEIINEMNKLVPENVLKKIKDTSNKLKNPDK